MSYFRKCQGDYAQSQANLLLCAGFQLWDSVQALCSYVRGMLTSQAMLVGIGLGKEAASPTAAVFNFLLR